MSETVKNTTDILRETQDKIDQQNKPAELITETCEFPVHTQGYITNTMELNKLVSSLFSVFKDYEGCSVYNYIGQSDKTLSPELLRTVNYGSFYVDLYFRKNTNSAAVGLDNLELARDASNGSVMNRLMSMSGGVMRNTYNLNKDTKHILTKFLSGYIPTNNFNPMWDKRVFEVPDPQSASPYNLMINGDNNRSVIVKVVMLSLDAIIGKIYGLYGNDDDNSAEDSSKRKIRYDYHAIPLTTSIAGVNPMMYGVYQNMSAEERANSQQYVIQVLRNDRSIIEATQKAIGYAPMTNMNGYVPFVR